MLTCVFLGVNHIDNAPSIVELPRKQFHQPICRKLFLSLQALKTTVSYYTFLKTIGVSDRY